MSITCKCIGLDKFDSIFTGMVTDIKIHSGDNFSQIASHSSIKLVQGIPLNDNKTITPMFYYVVIILKQALPIKFSLIISQDCIQNIVMEQNLTKTHNKVINRDNRAPRPKLQVSALAPFCDIMCLLIQELNTYK